MIWTGFFLVINLLLCYFQTGCSLFSLFEGWVDSLVGCLSPLAFGCKIVVDGNKFSYLFAKKGLHRLFLANNIYFLFWQIFQDKNTRHRHTTVKVGKGMVNACKWIKVVSRKFIFCKVWIFQNNYIRLFLTKLDI